MPLYYSRHNSNSGALDRNAKSTSSTAMTSRNTSNSSSSNTAYTCNEATSLLPHERISTGKKQRQQPSTTTSSATASLHQILTLHPRQIAILEAARAEEEAVAAAQRASQGEEETEEEMNRHVLSRIDCIEIDLWHERIRDYEAAELGLVRAEELGLVRDGGGDEEEGRQDVSVEVDEVDGGRLSRVQTYVNDLADAEGGRGYGSAGGKRRKLSSVAHTARLGSTSLSLNHFHPYFWVDVMGICLLVTLMLAFLVLIGFEIKYDREGICRGEGVGVVVFWVAVQMFVAMSLGLMLQIPVHRGLVPFVLPMWVVGTFGIVVGFKALAGCLRT